MKLQPHANVPEDSDGAVSDKLELSLPPRRAVSRRAKTPHWLRGSPIMGFGWIWAHSAEEETSCRWIDNTTVLLAASSVRVPEHVVIVFSKLQGRSVGGDRMFGGGVWDFLGARRFDHGLVFIGDLAIQPGKPGIQR